MSGDGNDGIKRELPLRGHAERALEDYLRHLNGHAPADLYNFVIREVEEPLLRVVLKHAPHRQCSCAQAPNNSFAHANCDDVEASAMRRARASGAESSSFAYQPRCLRAIRRPDSSP